MSESVLILWNQDQMFDKVVRLLDNAKTEILAFLSSYTLILTTDNELFQAPKRAARSRGVKLRYITEITKENLSHCKKQIDMVDELRHLDGIKGNFLMSDSEFIASHDISPENPITDGFYSDVDEIMKQELNVFETFWNHAIPAQARVMELEIGIAPTTTTTSAARPSPPPPHNIIRDGKRTTTNATRIDRFYVCVDCRSFFIYRDDVQEHRRTTGHDKMREFPILD